MDEQLDLYANYNASRYVHFRSVPTGEYEIVEEKRNGKIIPLRKRIFEKQKLSFEDVKALNLDNYGLDVRTAAEDFTLIHNYLLNFWSAIMGSEAVMVYIHLKSYCYFGKDFCFPDMETIQFKMKKGSRTTINKYMDILEDYGFIAKIQRIDTERNNGFSTPFFKVRRYIPFLSQELIETLPAKLKMEHDKFLAKANGIDLSDTLDTEAFVQDLMQSAEVMKSNNQKSKEEELKKAGLLKEYILSQLTTDEQEAWLMILQAIETKVSKPSFDTWIRPSIILVIEQQQKLKIFAPSDFVVDWVRREYKEILKTAVEETLGIKIVHFEIELYSAFTR